MDVPVFFLAFGTIVVGCLYVAFVVKGIFAGFADDGGGSRTFGTGAGGGLGGVIHVVMCGD